MLHKLHCASTDLIFVIEPCAAVHRDAVMLPGTVRVDELVLPADLLELLATG